MSERTHSKARVAASIEKAKADLDRALVDLDRLAVSDPAAIGYIAHALNNAFALLIATGRLDPISDAMRAHPDLSLGVAAALTAAGLAISLRS